MISSSEAILKAYTTKHSLNVRVINDLIKDVHKTPAFNANEVDTDMLQRLQASMSPDQLFRRPAEKVLRELMADMRLAVCQHFVFHEYKDPRGNRFFAGHSNGSVSFQLAQVRVGEGKVSFRPVYQCIYTISDIMPDVIADITHLLASLSWS
jgi:hypothetical protein